MRVLCVATVLLVGSCGAAASNPPDAVDATAGGVDARIVNGCPALDLPTAAEGDEIGGDTYETYAQGFLETNCYRCHHSTLPASDRSGAPEGYDWDQEALVRERLTMIRGAVGVLNFMPFAAPFPSCEDRLRFIRWIDAGAP